MITKEQIAEAAEQYAEQENSAWTNDYNGFKAGANFVLQNLQQCNVSGRSEQLKAFVEEYIEAWESGMAGDHSLYNKAKSL